MSGGVDVYKIFGIPIITKVRKGLNAKQINEWEAYNKLDPIGKWRDEYGWASLEASFTNLMTWAHAKRGTKHTAADFIPNWDYDAPEEVQQQTVEEMKKVFEAIAKSQNKKVGIQPKKPPKKKVE